MKNNLTLEERAQASDLFKLASPDLVDVRIALGHQLAIYRAAYYNRRRGIKIPNPDVMMAFVEHKDYFLDAILHLTEDELLVRPINNQNFRPNLDDTLQRLSLVFSGLAPKHKLEYENHLLEPFNSDSHLIYTALADMIQYVRRVLDDGAGMAVKVHKFKDTKAKLTEVPSEFAAFEVHTIDAPRRYDIFNVDNLTALNNGYAALVSKALGGHFRVTPKPRAETLDVTFYHPLNLV